MLDMMLKENPDINQAHANTLFSNIASTPAGHPIALDFLIARWDNIETSYVENIPRFISHNTITLI